MAKSSRPLVMWKASTPPPAAHTYLRWPGGRSRNVYRASRARIEDKG